MDAIGTERMRGDLPRSFGCKEDNVVSGAKDGTLGI